MDFDFQNAITTEKLEGTNVRITVRNHIKVWLPQQKTKFGNNTGIEGTVWHDLKTGEMCKIKVKDF